MLSRHKQDWEDLAHTDPLWAILSDPAKKGGRWNIDEFFESGEREITNVLARAESFNLPKHRRRSLDFGCGVGRLTRPLSQHFEESVGVDISETMISLAKRYNDNCSFRVNNSTNLSCFPDSYFDFIYSSLVLQHLPSTKMAVSYLNEFLRVLRSGGALVFQLPYAIKLKNRLQLRRRAYHVLRGLGSSPSTLARLGLHPMQMIAMSESGVTRYLTSAGATLVVTDEGPVDVGIETKMYYVTR